MVAYRTELERALAELRESEARLKETQRIAHVGWWERNFSTNHVVLSEEACRILGVGPVDLPEWHQRWLELIHLEDRTRAVQALAAALRGGPRYDVEYRVIRPDGAVRTVHARGDVTCDESGRPVRLFGVIQDVSELRQAEGELRASEARFRTFVDNATDAFFLQDDQLRILDVNRQACLSLGYSREELIGMHPRDFDVGLDGAAIERLRRRIEAGETPTFETRHRRKDGTVFPVEIRAVHFEQSGRRHLSLVRDITERRQAEEILRQRDAKIRRLFDANIIGIYFWDVDGPILDANDEFLRIVGYDRDDLLSGRLNWIEISPPEWRERIPDQLVALQSVRIVQPYEKDYIRKDGGRVTVLIYDSSFDETVRQGVCFALDLTERKRSENALREMQTQLAHAHRHETMGQLTASIAHEVNQPIAATLTNAEAALRWLRAPQPDLKEAQRALERIVRDASRTAEVVTSIRALFKKAPPSGDRVEINPAIREVIEFARSEAVRNRVSVRVDLAESLPFAQGDRTQLQQVVLNLVLNAVEATSGGEGPRDLLITTRTIESGEVLVAVADSGPGLAPAVQEKLFKPFTTTKPNGLGLGLSICRSIVEAHGGRLWATANAPRGAVFQFTLPVRAETS